MSKKNAAPKKTPSAANAVNSVQIEETTEPVEMTNEVRIGMIAGAIVGAIYGIAYATIPKIVKLDVGPVPGFVVGLFFGAGFGACFGGFIGGIGKNILRPKAFLGFIGGFLLLAIGRMADDTGEAIDKIMDIVVGGSFWGLVGAIAAALGVFDKDSTGEATAQPEDSTSAQASENAPQPSAEATPSEPVSEPATPSTSETN